MWKSTENKVVIIIITTIIIIIIIIAVDICLGTFSVKLQSEKANTCEQRLQLYDHIAYSPKLAVFLFVL